MIPRVGIRFVFSLFSMNVMRVVRTSLAPIRGSSQVFPSTYHNFHLEGRQRHGSFGTRFTKPLYDGHIPLNWFENAFLAVGSAVMSLVDPRRGGMLSVSPFSAIEAEYFMK